MNSTPHDLSNPSFLQKLALDLIRSRKSNYLEDCIYYHFQQSKFVLEDIPDLYNKYDHLLKCTFVRHRLSLLEKVQQDFVDTKKGNKISSPQKCIVYLHGLGSNRIEGFSLLTHLPKNYSLFTFDLSGSGKSQGQFTTYGFRQKQDIESILMYLYKQKNIREFVIWGRSMGAVASLLFNNLMAEIYTENSLENNSSQVTLSTLFQCVKCIVADSPFSSFEAISKDIALKKMSIPTFFTQIALKFLQNSFEKLLFDNKVKKCFTPFQIDFAKNILKPIVPIIFVYSLNDEIVNCDHSEQIINSIDKTKTKLIEKVIIPDCGHNLKRPDDVVQVIFQKIEKHCQPLITKGSEKIPSKQFQIPQNDPLIQKQTRNVRRKSFWNFEQQFSQNAEPKVENHVQILPTPPSEPENTNKFILTKPIQQHTRKNIFDRDQKAAPSKMNTSMTKKRGLSLSSTIERCQNIPNQQKKNFQSTQKTRFSKDLKSNNEFSFIRPMSVQNKITTIMPNEEQSRVSSPRKGIARCNAQIMNQNFSKSIKNRPSLGGNKPRISLGGSVQKRSKLSTELFKSNNQSKILSKQNYHSQIAPERDSSTPNNSFSTISYSDQTMYNSINQNKKFETINLNKQNKLSRKVVEEHFDSEPNIMKSEDFDLRRVSSRQSINTIDEGQLGKEIDESLGSFINTKLQFGLESFQLASGGFNKFKTISTTNGDKNKCKQSLILSEIDIKQVTEMAENSNKLSTITMPTHITLRPSSRLYHEKRKKKLQAHTILINKQNENVKITNDRYLNDD